MSVKNIYSLSFFLRDLQTSFGMGMTVMVFFFCCVYVKRLEIRQITQLLARVFLHGQPVNDFILVSYDKGIICLADDLAKGLLGTYNIQVGADIVFT